ncbi:hypothetical protein H5410_027282 [Solanum commersonii]|uniref:Uncharacterized protein n=1 Tax=Solanum commersonii TaxID=4109 RepID=A0A9J5Z404_SOLCO|nr:hypothetical protein H5410_027282 [Solanum commersonii]
MSTHSLGHQSSGLGFTTSLLGKSKTHGGMEKTHFQLGEDTSKNRVGRSFDEVSRCRRITRSLALLLFHCRFMLAFSIFTFWALGGIVLLRGTIRRSTDCSFHRLFDPLPSGLSILEQRVESVLSANRQRFLEMLMLQPLHSFQPFCS